jgi:outer membrane receptor for ferrienterochelin and colicin
MRLRAGVYNLGDHHYTAYLDVQGVPADSLNADRYRRPGREFNVAFDWSF